MKNLQLPLTKQWFYMTKSGEKPEDYREITPYWIKRFCNGLYLENGNIIPLSFPIDQKDYHRLCFKKFQNNIMKLGYPAKGNTEKILQYNHAGIEIREGNPNWGALPGITYFVIKHGTIINN